MSDLNQTLFASGQMGGQKQGGEAGGAPPPLGGALGHGPAALGLNLQDTQGILPDSKGYNPNDLKFKGLSALSSQKKENFVERICKNIWEFCKKANQEGNAGGGGSGGGDSGGNSSARGGGSDIGLSNAIASAQGLGSMQEHFVASPPQASSGSISHNLGRASRSSSASEGQGI